MSTPDRDNRAHPRYQAQHEICLHAGLSIFDAQTAIVPGQAEPLIIFGSTHDLSEAGVSLVVPLIPIDERYCDEAAHRLPLKLYLPSGEVTMQVVPVRCHPLDEAEPGKGFFMGAEIAEIDKDERRRLIEYLHTCS